jgi:anti-sigma factor RsiW
VPCETWKIKLDTYLDGELPSEEMRAYDTHVHSCSSCAADALARVQLKRGIQAAGKRFAPTSEFRRRVQGKIAKEPRRSFRLRGSAAIPQRAGLRRNRGPACRGAGQLIASRCGVHGSPHGEALVSREDPLRLRFAGSPKFRVYPPGGPHDLRRSITRRTLDLHRAETRNFRVRVPRRRVPG